MHYDQLEKNIFKLLSNTTRKLKRTTLIKIVKIFGDMVNFSIEKK